MKRSKRKMASFSTTRMKQAPAGLAAAAAAAAAAARSMLEEGNGSSRMGGG
jgi:hypothetical protein